MAKLSRNCLWCAHSEVDPYLHLVYCYKYQHAIPDEDLIGEATACKYFSEDVVFENANKEQMEEMNNE